MKVELTIKKEYEVKTLHVKAQVRYWEDSTVNGTADETGQLIPCREHDLFCPIIDVDTGIIINWNKGTVADIHYKVCDAGAYALKDSDGNLIIENDGYVPNILAPNGEGYGDYIILEVDENGKIAEWYFDAAYFEEEQ